MFPMSRKAEHANKKVREKEEDDGAQAALCRRLHDALSLGLLPPKGDGDGRHSSRTRSIRYRRKTWECSDASIQIHALKAMSAFISSSLPRTRKQLSSTMKESISEMLISLGGILQSGNKSIINLATDVTQKLLSSIGNFSTQFSMTEVVNSLLCLLSEDELAIATSCAVSLNYIFKKLTRGMDTTEICMALEEQNTVHGIVRALKNYVHGNHPPEYFTQMVMLLRNIMWMSSDSRSHVWNDDMLMQKLRGCFKISENSSVPIMLKLYSSLALCAHGAIKLLDDLELFQNILQHLDKCHSVDIRLKALTLCQYVMMHAKGNFLLTKLYPGPLVQGIVDAMGECVPSTFKHVSNDQMTLAVQAFHAAIVSLKMGYLHSHFWAHGVEKVLASAMTYNCTLACKSRPNMCLKEFVEFICDNFTRVHLYVCEMLGYLAVYCKDEYIPIVKGELYYLDDLICCTCSLAVASMQRTSLTSSKSDTEIIFRSVMMMVLSPCNHIALQARSNLSEHLASNNNDAQCTLSFLRLNYTKDAVSFTDSVHTRINLVSLIWLSMLPEYQDLILKHNWVNILSAIIGMCLENDTCVCRQTSVSDLQDDFDGRKCCSDYTEEWEDKNPILFYALVAFFCLGRFSNLGHGNCASGSQGTTRFQTSEHIISNLHYILNNNFGHGSKMYAASILSFFGIYGGTTNLGMGMEKALNDMELADLELLISNGQSFAVHSAILAVRCPSLLPSEELLSKYKRLNSGSANSNLVCDGLSSRHQVRISSCVDNVLFHKILKYVYSGFTLADDSLRRPLKLLAKFCQLEFLSDLLHRRLPRWGISFPHYNLVGALDCAQSFSFTDFILEAKTTERIKCECNGCKLTRPHMHVHKVILCMRCSYFRALFQSGMHDSFSNSYVAPVSWGALYKLVRWLYSDKLDNLQLDCRWKILSTEQQISELQTYIELSAVADFWLLPPLGERTMEVALSCLKSNADLALRIINFALNQNQWKVVDACIMTLAHLYPKLRDENHIAELDNRVVDKLRAEHARYSQGEAS